jgi:predicted transcriptional regulator of viral defense system
MEESAKSKLKILKPQILEALENLQRKIFTASEIEAVVRELSDLSHLKKSVTIDGFIKFLLEETNLKQIKLRFPSQKVERYIWGEVSAYKLALSLKPNAYFSHHTAMWFHGLTVRRPKIIYLKCEQLEKPDHQGSLEQKNIDWAFKQPPRKSKNVANYKDQKICLLYSTNTGNLGVIEAEDTNGERIRVSNVERTLIDISVRPFYSGGVAEILKAYKLAEEKVSIEKLLTMLKEMDFLYPYHQAIGFYLERSGVYEESLIQPFKELEMQYDFYLTNQMKDMSYSKEWHLYYPREFSKSH